MPAISEPTAATAAAPASADAALKPSFAEALLSSGRDLWVWLGRLDPRDVALNLAMSAVVVLAAAGAIWALRRAFDGLLHRFARATEARNDARPSTAAGVTWMLLRVAVLVVAALMLLAVWGVDPWAWLARGAGARLVRLALIALLAVALVEMAGFVISRLVEGVAMRAGDGRRAAQLRTLAPLLTGSTQAVLTVVGSLTFLAELGLKVGPILASAGVVGIAVGFGAQTLVKDFLTGLFLIAEDVVSVGDNVRVGDAAGTVETMTLRTLRLRDADGTLHIFPYSEAQVIHNRTKLFSSYLIELPISYDSDVDRALEVLREVGDGLRGDPEFASLITQPFEVLGVDRLTENGVYLKARLTTRPRVQWKVGREFNRRLKNAFDAARISTPVKTIPIVAQPLEEQRAQRAMAAAGD